jgi:DNA polymerase I-like protein with 3'-5' exonuclease and polymerase domains
MQDRVRATGYDPFNPTKEALARAKKECKADRSVCKTVVLACQYGAGVNKIVQTLENDDIFLEFDQVAAIHAGYWDLFSKVKDLGRSLHFEWKRNRGYILNGMGRPMAVPEDYSKDLLNRFIQSTGHDILVLYSNLVAQHLDGYCLDWKPLIMDFHDSVTVEVPEQDADLAVAAFNNALYDLNNTLQGTVSLRGVAVVGRNLAEVKEPEED